MGRVAWPLFVASWVIALFPRTPEFVSNRLHSLSGFGFILGLLLVAMFGYGLFLPPFFATLDKRIDTRLSGAGASPVAVFLRLFALQVLVTVASGPGALAIYLMNLVRGPSTSVRRFFEALDPVSRVSVVPFPLTATLAACASGSVRETMTRNWRWWKQDVLLFLPLALLAGAISGMASLLLRGLFGALPRATAVSATYSVIHAQVELAISVLAFCILLGNWLDQKEAVPPSLSHETPPEPAG
jgi:hypothetical protein